MLMQSLPCFLCGKILEMRTTRKAGRPEKPYFICDPCGTQYFVRGKQGREKLHTLMARLEGCDFFCTETDQLKIFKLLREMYKLQREIRRLEFSADFILGSEEKLRARNALQSRLGRVVEELEAAGEQPPQNQ